MSPSRRLAVGVHRALEAATRSLRINGDVDCEVIDLRSLRPLDVTDRGHSRLTKDRPFAGGRRGLPRIRSVG